MAYACGMHSGLGGWGWLIQLAIFILFFMIVWWLLKTSPKQAPRAIEKPIDILKRRLAKGEISKKEYETLKKELEK